MNEAQFGPTSNSIDVQKERLLNNVSQEIEKLVDNLKKEIATLFAQAAQQQPEQPGQPQKTGSLWSRWPGIRSILRHIWYGPQKANESFSLENYLTVKEQAEEFANQIIEQIVDPKVNMAGIEGKLQQFKTNLTRLIQQYARSIYALDQMASATTQQPPESEVPTTKPKAASTKNKSPTKPKIQKSKTSNKRKPRKSAAKTTTPTEKPVEAIPETPTEAPSVEQPAEQIPLAFDAGKAMAAFAGSGKRKNRGPTTS